MSGLSSGNHVPSYTDGREPIPAALSWLFGLSAGLIISLLLMLMGTVGCQSSSNVSSKDTQTFLSQWQAGQKTILKHGTTTSGQSTLSLTHIQPGQAKYLHRSSLSFTDQAAINSLPTAPFIKALNQVGVFQGSESSEFKPFSPITRGDYAQWLVKTASALRPPKHQIALATQDPPAFTDVPPDHPQYVYIQALHHAGLLPPPAPGQAPGTFGPDQPITRQALIAWKYLVDTGKQEDVPTFYRYFNVLDRDAIDDRYKGNVYFDTAHGQGPFKGNANRAFQISTLFKPNQLVLRHEAAATLWQMDDVGHWTAEAALQNQTTAVHNP